MPGNADRRRRWNEIELITRLRARAGTLDPVGIATTLLPGISPV